MVSGIQKAQQSLKIFTGVAAAESDAVAVQTKQAIENMAIEAPDTTQAVEVNALKDRLKLT